MQWILWTCGWWITNSACDWIDAHTRKLEHRGIRSEAERATSGFLAIVIWIVGIVIIARSNG